MNSHPMCNVPIKVQDGMEYVSIKRYNSLPCCHVANDVH